MHHEKVASDTDAIPIHNVQDDTIVFNRVSLCNIKHRNKRLGCAHSKVNVNFQKVLDNLETTFPQGKNQISKFKNEFESVIMKIYTLDHKVGHLEHDIAMSKLNNDTNKETQLLKSMRLLKVEHKSLMNQLSKIKSDIEQFILIYLD